MNSHESSRSFIDRRLKKEAFVRNWRRGQSGFRGRQRFDERLKAASANDPGVYVAIYLRIHYERTSEAEGKKRVKKRNGLSACPEFPWRDSVPSHFQSVDHTRSTRHSICRILREKLVIVGPVTNTMWPGRPRFPQILTATSRFRPWFALHARTPETGRCRTTLRRGNCLSRHENIYSWNFPWITPSFILSVRFPFSILRQ